MKAFAIGILSLALLFPVVSFADTSCGSNGVVCGNGNPENVMNAWGTTNSQLPHIQQGQTITDAAGITDTCPSWYPMYCVNLSNTGYYQNHARTVAAKLKAAGFDLGKYLYWLSH